MSGGFEVGERFGDFEILEVAGEGGMGIVYRARQITLERVIALKVISPAVAGASDFATRFRRESRLAASIDHPHVVSVHSAGEFEGQAYIAMQWVDGVSLDAMLVSRMPLAEPRTRLIVSQLAGALDAAHEKELVHRDVKPANVLVRSISGSDHAYLTDFGIARRVDLGATGLTKTGQTVGTIGYMAPEQIRGDQSDGRADLYSLGCVLYQCLTGCRPFEHDTEVAVMFAHVNEERPRPSALRPELAPFDALMSRALALNPDDRFQSGAELAESLAQIGTGAPAAGPTVAAVTPPAAPTRTAPTNELEGGRPPPPSPAPTAGEAVPPTTASEQARPDTAKRVLIGLAALLLVAAIGFGAFAAAGGFESDQPPTGAVGTDGADPGGGSGDGGGGTDGGGGGSASEAADRKMIMEVLDGYEAAYSNQDSSALASLLADNVTRFGVSDSGCDQVGVDEVIDAYESQFALGTGTYSFTDLSEDNVQVGGDTASVTSAYSISTGGGGSISFVLHRTGEKWLISDIEAPCP